MTMDPDQPQKPVSTTDGKQTAGHSYSTRSKANKRISNSDNDSSGSQSDQPPLKRQTRLRAQEAGNSAKIQINGLTPNSDPIIDASTADESTPAEIALRNHLVLESLLRSLNQSDLLRCRVLNKQWQYEATKELRRRKFAISFHFQSKGINKVSRNRVFQDFCRRLSKCRTPSLLSTFQVRTDNFNDLGSPGVGHFFTTIGNQLKHLALHLDYSSTTSSFENSTLMTDLQNLLRHQAPNLEFLEIEFDFPGHWKVEIEALDSPADHHQNDDKKFGPLPNLKTFLVTGTPPPNFFADVMNAAVNLSFVGGVLSTLLSIKWFITPGEDHIPLLGLSSECIKYFLGADEERDKIHLLKKFRVYLAYDWEQAEYDEHDIELIGTFLKEHKKNLQLETFECVSREFDADLFFAPGIVDVINQILESCAGSLLNLRIEPAKWFNDLLIIPRLPKLRRICFDCFWSSCVGLDLDGGGFFPSGFNMNNSFPNVSTIFLLRCAASFFRLFVERMKIEIKKPVPAIRRIIINFLGKDSDLDGVLPLASDLHHVFPNLLSVSYVDSGKYYKI